MTIASVSFSDLNVPIARPSRGEGELEGLVALARSGDSGAFAQLVRSLHRTVFRWALTFARDSDDADELTQETFVQVYQKLYQFRGDAPFQAWVYGITRSAALQTNRKTRRRSKLSTGSFADIDSVYNTDPGARVDRQRVADYIRHFFVELPPRQREVFDLVDLQGLEPVEVAALTGSTAAAVRGNLFKARAAIRAHLIEVHPAWRELSQ